MQNWSVEPITLDLKYTWKISRGSTDQKTNLIVTVTDGEYTGMGEAAPNIRYNESPSSLLGQFESCKSLDSGIPDSASELEMILKGCELSNALHFAIESAWHHLQAARKNIPVHIQLGLPDPGIVNTAYTIPIMDPGSLKGFFDGNKLHRFRYLKLKIDTESGLDTLRHVAGFTRQAILLDPNEAFRNVEDLIYFLEKIRSLPVELVEQPMPAGMEEEYAYLKKYSPFPLFADESILEEADFSRLKNGFHGVNVKLMKAGSYLNAIRLLQTAREHGMKTMIGCMVETSLGISSGIHLCSLCDYADLDSFLLVKDEPFGLIEEKDGALRILS